MESNNSQVSTQQQTPTVIKTVSESKIERAIVNSTKPIELNTNDKINVNGIEGIWANKDETINLDLSKYQLNKDDDPEIIHKKSDCVVKNQQISIKYLKPKPVKAGDIIIKQLPDIQEPAAPPLVIRKEGKKSTEKQSPLIIREAPPKAPQPIPDQIINVPGKIIPAPARKVVIEELPDEPTKPQDIIYEKWLPYDEPERRVIYEKACPIKLEKAPKNLLIKWEQPCVNIEKEYKDLGVYETDPEEYRNKYKLTKHIYELPKEATQIEAHLQSTTSSKIVTSAHTNTKPKLVGDLEALSLIDLDKAGLSKYKDLIKNISSSSSMSSQYSISYKDVLPSNLVTLSEVTEVFLVNKI